MNKQATRILLGCILCTIIVFLIFLIAIQFNQLSCELVRIEPNHLRAAQLHSFNKSKPIRSHDKTMLMKISAYLEYNIPAASSSSSSSSQQHQSSTTLTTTDGSTTPSSSLGNTSNPNQSIQPITGSSSGRQTGPWPSIPQFNGLQTSSGAPNSGSSGVQSSAFQHQPINGSHLPFVNNLLNQLSNAFINGHNSSQFLRDEERFLPLDLDEIRTRKLDDNRFKYSLTFNCSTLNMIIIRQPNRVYIESMSLELDPTSQKKSTCDILLPVPINTNNGYQSSAISLHQLGTIQAEGHDGLAHYHCRAPMTYSCFYFPSQKPTISAANSSHPTPLGNSQLIAQSLAHNGILVAELHINAIEFETRLQNSSVNVKSDSFKSKSKDCVPSNGMASALA